MLKTARLHAESVPSFLLQHDLISENSSEFLTRKIHDGDEEHVMRFLERGKRGKATFSRQPNGLYVVTILELKDEIKPPVTTRGCKSIW